MEGSGLSERQGHTLSQKRADGKKGEEQRTHQKGEARSQALDKIQSKGDEPSCSVEKKVGSHLRGKRKCEGARGKKEEAMKIMVA